MDIDKLKNAYYAKTNSEAAKEMGVSVPTLLKMIDRAGLERKGSGRPYNTKPPVYTSNAVMMVNKKCGINGYALFHMLLLDEEFISNNWDGQSSILMSEYGHNHTETLIKLYKEGFISTHCESNQGTIHTTILNREGFAMTENEFVKYYGGGK